MTGDQADPLPDDEAPDSLDADDVAHETTDDVGGLLPRPID